MEREGERGRERGGQMDREEAGREREREGERISCRLHAISIEPNGGSNS